MSYISYDRMDKIQKKIQENKEENKQSLNESTTDYLYQYMETIENTMFLMLGSIIWYFCVIKVLTLQKFPFHLYRIELILIIIIPILILGFILFVLAPKIHNKVD